jgi:hypothetical protein
MGVSFLFVGLALFCVWVVFWLVFGCGCGVVVHCFGVWVVGVIVFLFVLREGGICGWRLRFGRGSISIGSITEKAIAHSADEDIRWE